jgi:ferredoxin
MSTEIYYFSGTGNSLHVARELQKRIPDAKLMSIVHLLHTGAIQSSAETIGFVFPNFCLSIPIPLHDFLEKADLASARYIFAICTRGGSTSQAFDFINEILKIQGKRLNAQLNITMPWNHPVGKEDLTGLNIEERVDRLEAAMHEKLDRFSKFIAASKDHIEEDTDADLKLPSFMKVLDALITKSFNYQAHRFMYQKLENFYCDEKCKGCGTCEKVCLSGKIELVDKQPVWKKDVPCYACFACINFCPQQAIQVQSDFLIDSHTAENDRYHHKAITAIDIAEQR